MSGSSGLDKGDSMSGPELVIAMYKPKQGKHQELETLVKKHVPALKEYGLITEREPLVFKSENGTVIEIFEWQSREASKKAHDHPAIAKIWEAMAVVGDFEKLGNLPEAGKVFPHFKMLND